MLEKLRVLEEKIKKKMTHPCRKKLIDSVLKENSEWMESLKKRINESEGDDVKEGR